MRHDQGRRKPKLQTRKVERPSYDQLKADLKTLSFLAVGRKYGVSDNAIRKWLRWYEYQTEQEPARRETPAPCSAGRKSPGENGQEQREAA